MLGLNRTRRMPVALRRDGGRWKGRGDDRPLILKRAPIGWNQDDFDMLEDGVIVGRIFRVPIAPQGRPWMWASGHNGHIRAQRTATSRRREAAMAAFAKSGCPKI